MQTSLFFTVVLFAWLAVAAVTFVSLFFVSAPYGRHSRPGWGPSVQARTGWLVMEAVSPIFFAFFLFLRGWVRNPVVLTFFGLWFLHYVNRSFIYPFRMRGGRRPMALTIVLMACAFNVVNGYMNGTYLRAHEGSYGPSWFAEPRFIVGIVLFLTGFFINLHSDGILRRLRSGEDTGYKIPRGGFFNRVTSANYFGEILEWFGWACCTWSVAGLAFAVWAACNLVPRARAHHLWYLDKFPDYPKNRKAVIPYIY